MKEQEEQKANVSYKFGVGRLIPEFWRYAEMGSGPHRPLFNFRRIWKLATSLIAGVALIPLIVMAAIDYKVTQSSVESENLLQAARLVSNTRRSVSFFLSERKSALDFIVRHQDFETLNRREKLQQMLEDLKVSFGGFVDLGVVDPFGNQRTYVGPYELEGVDYSGQAWYEQVLRKGDYISEVFLGFRNVPHLVIAVKRQMENGLYYVIRATLDTARFNDLLTGLEMSVRKGDAFLINREGRLQTPTNYHGGVFETVSLPVPGYSSKTEVSEIAGPGSVPLIVGYAYIEETPFILMIVKEKPELMEPWYETRTKLMGFLVVSVTVILFVILGVATYLVNRIYLADQRRVMVLHHIEYSNKMATLGRLAAGVAHEINNPLAVINEKAGLIKDIFTLKEIYARDEKLIGLVDSILRSVDRCAKITKRLLSFMRKHQMKGESLDLKEIITEVLSFMVKEAEYRSIAVSLKKDEGVPNIESDKGRLEEIFLNVITNSFAAMENGGHLDIAIMRSGENSVAVTVTDDGCGIPREDLQRIFEPFFSTRTGTGGTGLGLSITFGLVQEMSGRIQVVSDVGKGTTFTITFPVKTEGREG